MKISFKNWFEQQFDTTVDETQIDAIYDKAKISVELVRMYNPELLNQVGTIANLATGSYGLYNSGENLNVIEPSEEQKIIMQTQGQINKEQLQKMRPEILKKYYPNVDSNKFKFSDTIQINVNRILNDPKVNSDLEAIMQIGATIVHEATHNQEYRTKGYTNETAPMMEEKKFLQWAAKQEIQAFIQTQLQRFNPTPMYVHNQPQMQMPVQQLN